MSSGQDRRVPNTVSGLPIISEAYCVSRYGVKNCMIDPSGVFTENSSTSPISPSSTRAGISPEATAASPQ